MTLLSPPVSSPRTPPPSMEGVRGKRRRIEGKGGGAGSVRSGEEGPHPTNVGRLVTNVGWLLTNVGWPLMMLSDYR